MAVTITAEAKRVAALANSGGGYNGGSDTQAYPGTNSVWEIAGVWYVLAVLPPTLAFGTDVGHFQWYKSSDAGATWATSGSAFTVTGKFGGGMTQHRVGTQLWVSHSIGNNVSPHDAMFYLVAFDTATETWGAETSINLSTAFSSNFIYGIFLSYVRPDGSFVFLLEDTGPTYLYALVYAAGSFSGPYQITARTGEFESSIMRTDGTIDVFYYAPRAGFHQPADFYHHSFSPANVASAESLMTTSAFSPANGEVNNWDGFGLGYGILAGGVYYLACGQQTSDAGTFGKPAILFGVDGGWTMSSVLDTGLGSGYSVYSAVLQLINDTLVYYCRVVSSDGGTWFDRIGYAPVGSHNTPAAWTWASAYDFGTPTPAVSGETGPYNPQPLTNNIGGALTGLAQATEDIRIVTTLRNAGGDFFVTYLLNIHVPSVIVYRNTFE